MELTSEWEQVLIGSSVVKPKFEECADEFLKAPINGEFEYKYVGRCICYGRFCEISYTY